MVTATLTEEQRLIADLNEFQRNAKWFSENRRFLQEHLDQYVAVDHQQVVGVEFDPRVLNLRFEGRREVYITWVGPPDLLWVL